MWEIPPWLCPAQSCTWLCLAQSHKHPTAAIAGGPCQGQQNHYEATLLRLGSLNPKKNPGLSVMRWSIRVGDKDLKCLVTRLSVGCLQCELGHTDKRGKQAGWRTEPPCLNRVVHCGGGGGGLAARAHGGCTSCRKENACCAPRGIEGRA